MESWGREAYELGAIPIMRTGHFCLNDLIFSFVFLGVLWVGKGRSVIPG